MSLGSALVWECRASGGNDLNGGAFLAGATGTDFSQQNAAQVVIDNSTVTTSITANVITFTGYTPTAADVGNVVQMASGTNVTVGPYQITAQTATTWTVTGAVNLPTSGTTTNATGRMGGALATLGKLAGAMVASNKAYATGAFTQTATPTFAQSLTPTTTAQQTQLIGYNSTRGDGGRATITLSTNSGLSGIAATGLGFSVSNIEVDCANLTTSTGINITGANYGEVRNCKVSRFTSNGIVVQTNSGVVDCEVTAGTAAAVAAVSAGGNGPVVRCFIHDNACVGATLLTSTTLSECLIANNTGATADGITCQWGCFLVNNTVHGNGRHGLHVQGSFLMQKYEWKNNVFTNNGGFGILADSAIPASPSHDGNAFFSNTSGTRSGVDDVSGINGVAPYTNVRDKILTGSPYIGPTTGTTANFALNNTPGAGAACRAAGSPGTWPGNTGSTGYLDMGAVQSRAGTILSDRGTTGGFNS